MSSNDSHLSTAANETISSPQSNMHPFYLEKAIHVIRVARIETKACRSLKGLYPKESWTHVFLIYFPSSTRYYARE